MTGNQARRLIVGDKVFWVGGAATEEGEVVAVNRFAVRIKWSDGRITEPFFNDMRKIEMAPANAQASAG
jgi:hypothetical protein